MHIQDWLARRRADEDADAGRHRLVEALAEHDYDLLAAEVSGESLAIARNLGYGDVSQLYAALTTGALTLEDLVQRFTAA